jgi:hypothetical protein
MQREDSDELVKACFKSLQWSELILSQMFHSVPRHFMQRISLFHTMQIKESNSRTGTATARMTLIPISPFLPEALGVGEGDGNEEGKGEGKEVGEGVGTGVGVGVEVDTAEVQIIGSLVPILDPCHESTGTFVFVSNMLLRVVCLAVLLSTVYADIRYIS